MLYRLPPLPLGDTEPLTKPELTCGLLQHTLQDTAQQAAMASLLCSTAGWHGLSDLLSTLSMGCAAGGRRELRPLLEVRLHCTLHTANSPARSAYTLLSHVQFA